MHQTRETGAVTMVARSDVLFEVSFMSLFERGAQEEMVSLVEYSDKASETKDTKLLVIG